MTGEALPGGGGGEEGGCSHPSVGLRRSQELVGEQLEVLNVELLEQGRARGEAGADGGASRQTLHGGAVAVADELQ